MTIYTFIYLSLKARITALVPDIKFIDLFDDQPNRTEEGSGNDLPAAYLEFKPVQWTQRAGGSRFAMMQIDLHLETNREGTSTASNTPDSQLERGLYPLELMGQLYIAIQGYNDGNELCGYDQMVNIGDTPNTGEGVTRVDIMSFLFRAIDNTNVPVLTEVTVSQSINVNSSST